MVTQLSTNSAQRERLYFIEFVVLFLGTVRRKDVVNQFDVSEAAATKDLSLYSDVASDMLEYHFRKKCYLYKGGTPVFEHDVDKSLFALAGERRITQYIRTIERVPSSVETSIKRRVPLETVATITRSIHQIHKLKALYRSLRSGERTRVLTPTALIHDGLRWHIRCFDHDDGAFKDHNLARFMTAEVLDASDVDYSSDGEWQKFVDLKLVPHPRAEHPETIRLDYDIEGQYKVVKVRSCQVGYFLRHWPIDYSDDASDDPRYHQLFLANRDELIEQGVDEWSFV